MVIEPILTKYLSSDNPPNKIAFCFTYIKFATMKFRISQPWRMVVAAYSEESARKIASHHDNDNPDWLDEKEVIMERVIDINGVACTARAYDVRARPEELQKVEIERRMKEMSDWYEKVREFSDKLTEIDQKKGG